MMTESLRIENLSKSAQIRARLTHPIIDSDGHSIENSNILFEYVRSVAGPGAAERFRAAGSGYGAVTRGSNLAQARDMRMTRGPWWSTPAANTVDRATAMLPKLLYERMAELGLDFSVLYTTIGMPLIGIEDDELRRSSCRALNKMRADMMAGFEDHLTPAAVIPMHTPQEAVAELEYAVRELGMKAAMVASFVKRHVPAVARKYPGAAGLGYTLDVYGIDSDYDYDPFWAKCEELGIAPTFHSLGIRGAAGDRPAITSTTMSEVLQPAPRRSAKGCCWVAYRSVFQDCDLVFLRAA
jgi:hypothetical protein